MRMTLEDAKGMLIDIQHRASSEAVTACAVVIENLQAEVASLNRKMHDLIQVLPSDLTEDLPWRDDV